MPCKFNLIYFNTHEGSEFRCSDEDTIRAFRRKLVEGGAMCTIRQSRGDEEMAAQDEKAQASARGRCRRGGEGGRLQRVRRLGVGMYGLRSFVTTRASNAEPILL
jgi:ribosomal protein S21